MPLSPLVTHINYMNYMNSLSLAVSAKSHVGIFVYSQKSEEESNAILIKVRNYLRSLPFAFHNASIISGQEEGLYGWITVNYLMGKFLEVRPVQEGAFNSCMRLFSIKATWGFLPVYVFLKKFLGKAKDYRIFLCLG